MEKKTRRAIKPDAQAFDEIRIVIVPRYKTSGLSGDEWRISAVTQFLRNGRLICESDGVRDVETAASFLPFHLARAIDDGNAFYAGEGDICDQEGCADIATVTYRVKKQYSRDNPHKWNRDIDDEVLIRKFCARHSTRGDCAFDDADSNYEILEGNRNSPIPTDESPSAFGGAIVVE